MDHKAHEILRRYASNSAWSDGDSYWLSFNSVASISKLEHSRKAIIETLEAAKRSAVEQIDHVIGELQK